MGWSSTGRHASEDRDLISAPVRTSSVTSSIIFGHNPRHMLFVNGSSDLKLLHLEKQQQIRLLILKAHSISTLYLSFQSSTTGFSSLLQFLSDRQQKRDFLFVVHGTYRYNLAVSNTTSLSRHFPATELRTR